MTPSELGALMLVAAIAFNMRSIFVRTTAVLGFLGVVLLGTTGWAGRVLSDVTGYVERVGGTLGATIFGSAAVVGIGVVLFLGIHYVHDLHPKMGRASSATLWYGVALGAIVVAGQAGIPALNGLHQGILSAVSALNL